MYRINPQLTPLAARKQLLLVDKDRNLFVHGTTEEVLDKDLLEKIYKCGMHIHREEGRITISVNNSEASRV